MVQRFFRRRRVRTNQPQGCTSFNSAFGVTSAFLPTTPTVVQGPSLPTTISASNVAFRPTLSGIVAAVFTDSANTCIRLAADADLILPTDNCTIAVFRRCTDTTARDSNIFGYSQSSTDLCQAVAPYTDGNLYWDFGNVTTGRLSVAYTKDTSPETLVFVAGKNKGREIWRRGVKIAANAAKNASRPATAASFYLGAKPGVSCDNQEIYLIVISPTEWTDEQVKAFCRNPWLVFANDVRSVFYGSGAGGGSTYSDSTTESLSALDSSSCSRIRAASIVESATATDAATAIASQIATITEALTASESTLSALITFVAASEAMTAAETSSSLIFNGSSIAESESAGDSSSVIATLLSAIAEAATAATTQSSVRVTAGSSTEAASATETSSTSGQVASGSVSEAASAADSLSAIYAAAASIVEAANALDSPAAIAAMYAAVAEHTSATELAWLIANATLLIIDPMYIVKASRRQFVVSAENREFVVDAYKRKFTVKNAYRIP